jgi:hypothetical protein
MNLKIVPFLAWFAVGFAGTTLAAQLRATLGNDIASNLGLLIFLLGGIAACEINKRLGL